MTSQRRRHRASIKSTVLSVESLLLALPPSAYISPGVLDNNAEQTRNKLKISAYVLETT